MLGLGWSEMLVIAVVVLIVVGPKDLPVMLRNVGRMMGTVRRMSNEFRREIDKAIAADEFREAKKSISDPLRQTTADITREFNTIRDGRVEPSGKLKPADPNSESVVDEIRAKAGIPATRAESPAAVPDMRARANEVAATPPNAATTTAEQPAPIATPEPAKTKSKAAPRNGVTSTAKSPVAEDAPAKAVAKRKPAAKASAAKGPKKAAKPTAKSQPAAEPVAKGD